MEKDFFDSFDFSKNLIICWPIGVGKTYKAKALLDRYEWDITYSPRSWKYRISDAKFKELIAEKQLSHKPPEVIGIEAYPLELLLRCDVILFDDIGVSDVSDAYIRKLTYILDERSEKWRKHIFTTNLTEKEMKEKLHERITSRILANAIVVTMTGKDKRRIGTQFISYQS